MCMCRTLQMIHFHWTLFLPPPASFSRWRSSLLSSSWSAWIYGTESFQSHLPTQDYLGLQILLESFGELSFHNKRFNVKQYFAGEKKWLHTVTWLTCLTAMLTLTELMEPSIRTFSLSLRLMITGWRSNSLLLLKMWETHNSLPVLQDSINPSEVSFKDALEDSPYFHFWLVVSLYHLGGEILQAEGSL